MSSLLSESAIIEEMRNKHEKFSKIQSLFNEVDAIHNELSRRANEYFSKESLFNNDQNDNSNIQTIKTASIERENSQRILYFLNRFMSDTAIPPSLRSLATSLNITKLQQESGRLEVIERMQLLKQLLQWKPPQPMENVRTVQEFYDELNNLRTAFGSKIRDFFKTQFDQLKSFNSLDEIHSFLKPFESLLDELYSVDSISYNTIVDHYAKHLAGFISSFFKSFNFSNIFHAELVEKYSEFCRVLCGEIFNEQVWLAEYFKNSSHEIITSNLLYTFAFAKNSLSDYVKSISIKESNKANTSHNISLIPTIVSLLVTTEKFIAEYQDDVNAVAALLSEPQLLLSQLFNSSLGDYSSFIKSFKISPRKNGVVAPSVEISKLVFSIASLKGGTASLALTKIFDSFCSWLLKSTESNKECRIDNLAFVVSSLKKEISDENLDETDENLELNAVVIKYFKHLESLLEKESQSFSKSLVLSYFGYLFDLVDHVNSLIPIISKPVELRCFHGTAVEDILLVRKQFNSNFKNLISSMRKKVFNSLEFHSDEIWQLISQILLDYYEQFDNLLKVYYKLTNGVILDLLTTELGS
ncbi:hypothetical protein P9112_012755 [Eukaryota sp. TZLM1-RC]